MEEMNNEVLTDVSEVIIDEVSDLTLGQKCVGYALVGFCAVGVITAGTAAVKGATKLYKNIKDKKRIKEAEVENEVVDVEETDIHEVKNEETEEN